MARPSKYDEHKADLIVKYIQGGGNRADAAQAAGVPERTLYRWMNRNAEFRQRVMEADATAVIVAEGLLKKKNPLAYLQAKRPLLYGNLGKQNIEITGAGGGPVQVAQKHGFDDAEREQFEQLVGGLVEQVAVKRAAESVDPPQTDT